MNIKAPNIRITFRMTDEVHKLLNEAIEKSGRSMNAEINIRLLESLQGKATSLPDDEKTELATLIRSIIREELDKKSD